MDCAVFSSEASVVALALLTLLAFLTAAWRLRQRSLPAALRIDAILPQTQCGQCGYDGCRPYADAIAGGRAPINRCPPGGERVIRRLAALTGQPASALDTSRGRHKPRQLAVIDETRCIGCTLCIQVCPVDAIIGAAKMMHTVVASHCTGCELCLPPCPVDCIALRPAPRRLLDIAARLGHAEADAARRRFERRTQRLEKERLAHANRLAARAAVKLAALEASADPALARKRAIVQAALDRARAKLASARRAQDAPRRQQ